MSKKSNLWLLLSGASLAAMGALTPAMAQDEDVSEEIVVTATGRAAAIQDVPIAVTAIGNEQLEQAGVRSLLDLRQLVPSMRIGTGQSQTSGTAVSIRGIGTGSDNPGFEAAVGVFIDGVYRARTGAALSDLPDIERVEVLRGPQGTLYGKNTSSGALSVITAGPDFEPGAWLEGTAGDFDMLGTRFGANMPLSESVAIRVDGALRAADGFVDDVVSGGTVNNTNRWNARAQMLWDISSDASLRIILDGGETDEACCAAVTLGVVAGPIDFGAAVNGTQAGSILTSAPDARLATVSPNRSFAEQAEDRGISAQLDWDLGFANLTSISAARQWDATRNQDIDFSRMDRSFREGLEVGVESISQEIRLQGEAGRLNWLVGAFGSSEEVDHTDRIRHGTQAARYLDVLAFGATSGTDDLFGTLLGPAVTDSIIHRTCQLMALTNDPLAVNNAASQAAWATCQGVSGLADDVRGAGAGLSGAGQQSDVWNVQTESFSLFTHNEFSLSDNMVLTFGARWNTETKDLTADLLATQPVCDAIRGNLAQVGAILQGYTPNPLIVAGPLLAAKQGAIALQGTFPALLILGCNPAVNNLQNGHFETSVSEDAVSGVVSLAYHLSDDLMVYGSYSRGYKSGGFNIDRSGFSPVLPTSFVQAPASSLGFDPETTDAYELGFKSTVFGGAADFNVTAFYQQITDLQSNNFNGFNFITQNVPQTISQGVEIEFSARPMDNLSFTAGATYLDAYYDSTVAFGATASDTIFAGSPITQSPEWTVTGSVNYSIPVGGSMLLNMFADGRWVSDYRTQTLGRNPITDQEAFALFDARLGLGSEDGRWGVDLFVQNVTDEFFKIAGFAVPEQSLSGTGRFAAFVNQPRTYGVTLRARY